MGASPLSSHRALELTQDLLDSYKKENAARKTAMVNAILMLQDDVVDVNDVISVLLKGM